MESVSADEAQLRLSLLIDETAASHEPVVIKGNLHNAVLLSEQDWSAIQETLFLLSIPGMRETIREGMATPIDDCDAELTW